MQLQGRQAECHLKKIYKGLQNKLSVYVPVVFVMRILHSFINGTLLWHLYCHKFHVKIIEDMKNISCKIDRCDSSLSLLQISCAKAVNVISCVVIFSICILAVLINLNSKVECKPCYYLYFANVHFNSKDAF